LKRVRDKHGQFPPALKSWLDYDLDKADEFLNVLRAIRDGAWSSYDAVSQESGAPKSTISTWKADGDEPPLEGIIVKEEFWSLRPPGEFALEFPWRNYLE